MREVVKKEVLKLLHAGIIYPMPHSEWVSPVQVVPKKGGMTVVKNEKNELIPQHVCGIYIVANLILLCSLETCLSYFELKNFARAYGPSFHTFLFFSFFTYLDTCPFF
jgi:hypothetical protein